VVIEPEPDADSGDVEAQIERIIDQYGENQHRAPNLRARRGAGAPTAAGPYLTGRASGTSRSWAIAAAPGTRMSRAGGRPPSGTPGPGCGPLAGGVGIGGRGRDQAGPAPRSARLRRAARPARRPR
jgi:hypothetical protein